jgi:tetratricopeptide (TPR) repeat protein
MGFPPSGFEINKATIIDCGMELSEVTARLLFGADTSPLAAFGWTQMSQLLNRIFLLLCLPLVIFAAASIASAKDRNAENCTANRGIKPDIRISACTRVLKETGVYGDFGDAAAFSNRASAYAQKGDYNRALRDLNDAVSRIAILGDKIDEDPVGRMIAAGIFGNRGLVNLALHRQAEATADFKQALFIEPTILNYKEGLRRLDETD